MSESQDTKIVWRQSPAMWGMFLVLSALTGYVYMHGLTELVRLWDVRLEYSYGYIVPFITLFLIWQRKDQLEKIEFTGSWWGVLVAVIGLFLLVVGELTTLFLVIHYSFLFVVLGAVLSLLGWKAFKIIFIPLFFLAFMIPLPSFFLQQISQVLQLVSSQLGVWVIRLFDISVYLEGNVIDLGVYKLQVVDACSGLRYLFPLMALSFMMAYFYQDKLWKRVIIFLSSIPITIIMNSFRIGMIGVMVEYWGIKMAEGFLHDFEGWVIFMACMLVLLAEMWLLTKLGKDRRPFKLVFGIDFPADTPADTKVVSRRIPPPFIGFAFVIICASLYMSVAPERKDIIPPHQDFYSFPLAFDGWKGSREGLKANILDALKVDDYLLVDYQNKNGETVNFYVAYYASQKKGQSAHSPRTCIPGGGWEIQTIKQVPVTGVVVNGVPLIVNRTVIQKGELRQLVYYWFQERGRILTNEYIVKWYILWDALTKNRTDGALVRLVTMVPPGESIEKADKRLVRFADIAMKKMHGYLPD
ncbi:EpsH [hydrothermal vent metagenome]|uniref:EpsH n=1 Tax=hydrothermal vent metagenome TaxID=652676 RepID=A0A3B1C917_9ZZZZ